MHALRSPHHDILSISGLHEMLLYLEMLVTEKGILAIENPPQQIPFAIPAWKSGC